MRKLITIILVASLYGCGTPQIVREPYIVQVPILPLPELPKLTPEQEQSIPEEAYLILVQRDETLVQHIERINKIITTHNDK